MNPMNMRNRKHRLEKTLGVLAVTTLLGLLALGTTPASASLEDKPASAVDRAHKLNLKYDVYAGGLKALNASLVMDLGKKAYDMRLHAETQGMIGSLFPWKASYNTSGHAEQGRLIPSVHTESSTWKNSVKTTEMDYAPSGKLLKATTQEGATTTVDRDIDTVLTDKAVDVLTGTLVMMQNAKKTNACTGKFPVFDGKRRFNIVLKDDGTEVLPKSDYSKFSGEAMRCIITVEPVAGFKPKDQKRGWMAVQNHTEERHKLPTLWLAKVGNSGQVVPVRMEIASDYGTVVAHLSGDKIN